MNTRIRTTIPALFAVTALIAASIALPGGALHEEDHAIVEFSLGVDYEENFQEDDGGWDANTYEAPGRPDPRNPSWERGAPTSGPGEAASGENAWATNLDGDANLDECSAILSPTIDLTDAGSANVSFTHWYAMEVRSFSGTAYDAGALFVTSDGGHTLSYVTPDEGYPTEIFWSPTRDCLDDRSFSDDAVFSGTSEDWENSTIDLDAFLGQTVQVVFGFSSRTSNPHPGWYIDDFTVTIDNDTSVEDFEAGDGGFTIITTEPVPDAPQGFSWDDPTTGPTVTMGDMVWATNPHGDYGPAECSYLESPPITIGESVPEGLELFAETKLSWEQWFRTHSGVGQGVVQIGTGDGEYVNIEPDGGYPGNTRFSKDWHYECLGIDDGGTVFAGSHNSPGDTMVEYSADVSEWMGEQVTVRFLFATDPDQSLRNLGWYVDDVLVESRFAIYPAVAPEETVEEVLDQVPDPTSTTTPPGWSVGGKEPSWEYGLASDGPAGEIVFMTNLAGATNPDECGWAQTPMIPGALLAMDPTLEFDHWYHTYMSFSSGPWSAGVVQVSTDGENWTHLDVDGYTDPITSAIADDCFVDVLGMDYPVPGSFAGESGEFVTGTADLSEFVGEETVQFRFVYGSGISIGRPGWALRSVQVAGIDLITDL